MNKSQILQQIQQRRKKLGVSQREISQNLQMTQPLYSGYETGKSDVGLDKLLQICQALDLEIMLIEKEGMPPLPEAQKKELKILFAQWLDDLSP